MPDRPFIVVAPTFYTDRSDDRFTIALDLCRQAAKLQIRLILVDDSPDHDQVRTDLERAGRDATEKAFVQVQKQRQTGKKGVALREGIAAALDELSSAGNVERQGVICFQEPEKIDMLRHWESIISHMHSTNSDICVPRRSHASFQSSYPIEQYHSESFANLHLDSLARQVGFPSIDWTAGPIALSTTKAPHWLEYNGEIWDAQIVPMVVAQRWHGCSVSSLEVDFILPAAMKQQEEGSPKWGEKRLLQLNLLFEIVGKALKETEKPY